MDAVEAVAVVRALASAAADETWHQTCPGIYGIAQANLSLPKETYGDVRAIDFGR